MTEQLTLSTNVPHIKNTEVLVECKYIVLKIIIFVLFCLKFIYLWLCWVFIAAFRLFPAAVSGGYSVV